ncbi:hypothetical protein DVA76_19810, partial [Acinetobacter baumannii]
VEDTPLPGGVTLHQHHDGSDWFVTYRIRSAFKISVSVLLVSLLVETREGGGRECTVLSADPGGRK